jgi:hypothetical protein
MQGPYLRKYGVQTTINFTLFEVDGVDFRVDAVDAGSDCSIMKDEGAENTCTNDFVDEGTGYSLVLTATEMQAARIIVYIKDSATKVWLDESIAIETYGNASATHAFDLDTALQSVNTTQIEGADATDQLNSIMAFQLANINLDHLMKTPVANNADMTNEIADGTVMSNLLSATSNTSTYTVATDSQEALSDTLGVPANIDGGGATIANNIKKMADDNDGGDFDATLHSQKAIRDRGDTAWLTGSGAGAENSYTSTDWTRTVGDNDGGVASDTATVNGSLFSTGETNSGTFLEVDVTFDIADGETAVSLDVWGFYNGGAGHSMLVQAFNYTDSVYEPLSGSIPLSTTVQKFSFDLAPGNTDATNDRVQIKFIHSGTGNPAHVFSVDKAAVNASTITNNVNVASMDAGVITAAAIATDAIDADALATDAVTEIVNGLKTSTGWTNGSTKTYADVVKYIVTAAVGNVVDGDSSDFNANDIDDDTEVFSFTLSPSTPYRNVTLT